MKISHYSQSESKCFESDAVKGVTGRVVIGKADGADNFCMRVFELAEKGYTPKHSHEWEHEIFVHSGRGEIFCDGKWMAMESGYVIFVPGNEEHHIRNTGSDTLIFVCVIPSGVPEL